MNGMTRAVCLNEESRPLLLFEFAEGVEARLVHGAAPPLPHADHRQEGVNAHEAYDDTDAEDETGHGASSFPPRATLGPQLQRRAGRGRGGPGRPWTCRTMTIAGRRPGSH